MGPPPSHLSPAHDANSLSQETEEAPGWLQGTRQPIPLGGSCPITQPVRPLQHLLQEPEEQGKPGPGSWLMRGDMKGDVKPMSGKGELRGCGRARLTGVAADGIAATCWHGAGARPESNIGNISTRRDNYTLELLASEAPSRVEQIP